MIHCLTQKNVQLKMLSECRKITDGAHWGGPKEQKATSEPPIENNLQFPWIASPNI